jgi:hypothetical protein
VPLKSFLRIHAAALALAVAAGLILGSPHLRRDAPSPYLQGDEWKEAANIEAVRAGHWGFSEMYIVEHRDAPWPYPRSPYWFCGLLARALGGTDRLFVAADFVLPPAIFLLLYALLLRLRIRRALALWICVVWVLHHSDLYALLEPISRRGLMPTLHWYRQPIDMGSIFSDNSYTLTRFPFPLLSLPLALLMLTALESALRRGHRIATVTAGLLLGAITYARFFDWMILYPALMAAVGLLCVRRAWNPARTIGFVVAIGLLVSAPYWIPALGHAGDSAVAATLEHSGLERTHRLFPLPLRSTYPAGPLCVAALLAACPFVGLRTPGRLAFVAAVLGFVPCLVFQVVSGWTVSPDHFYRDTIFPFFCGALAYGFGALLFRFGDRVGRIGVGVAGAAACLHAAFSFGGYRFEGFNAYSETRDALAHVEPGAVVLAQFPEAVKVAGPHCQSFLTSAPWSPVSTSELLERYLIARKIFGATREEITVLFEPGHHADLWGLVGGEEFAHYEEPSGLRQGRMIGLWLPPAWKDRVMNFYDALPSDPDALIAFARARYRIDYVLTSERPIGADRWPVVFAGPKSVTLYRVGPTPPGPP